MPTLQAYLHNFPQLQGKPFGHLFAHFPEGTPYGIVRKGPRRCILNPEHSLVLKGDDEIILLRPTDLARSDFWPLSEPVKVDPGAQRLAGAALAGWHIARAEEVCQLSPLILGRLMCTYTAYTASAQEVAWSDGLTPRCYVGITASDTQHSPDILSA